MSEDKGDMELPIFLESIQGENLGEPLCMRRCGLFDPPPILTPRELRAAKFVYRFINRQMDRVKAGKSLRLPEPLQSSIKRRALEADLDL